MIDANKKRLAYLLDVFLHPGKHLTPSGGFIRNTAAENEELREANLLPKLKRFDGASEDQPKETTEPLAAGGFMAIPNRITRQSALAQFLHNYFRGQLAGIEIKSQTLNDWRNGERLKWTMVEGNRTWPVPFPGRDKSGIGWDPRECIAWIKKWIVPHHTAPGPGGGDMLGNEDIDYRDNNERKKGVLLDFDIGEKMRQLIPRASAELTAMGVIQRLHTACTTEDEQAMPRFLGDLCRKYNLAPAVTSALLADYTAEAQAVTARRVTRFEEASKEALKEEGQE